MCVCGNYLFYQLSLDPMIKYIHLKKELMLFLLYNIDTEYLNEIHSEDTCSYLDVCNYAYMYCT